ncbi:hypothetical protein K0O13_01515 [Mammaliicoccus sciuri]|uniref:hypothetical protein n=1 Tax=Mammaliicoccus sciuri TaxID=1296 RepID=UPI001C63A380|nr:hypothetical protein [Mammaliicoccus sciuri]QYG32823.1 hypothetical protein K0O13_01515 [Mammaliicoccus sciuri]
MIREIFQDITDTFDMNQWNVLWTDDKGKSHGKRFYYKHHARDFYKSLPYMNKRMERV